MRIGILVPSRGLVHSRTVESILRNLKGFDDYFLKFSHDKPIPDAHNYLVNYAQSKVVDYYWFVEEDNIIPDGTLRRMVNRLEKSDAGVIAVDYPVGEKAYSTIRRENGKILWCAFGCTLFKKYVFEKLKKPWFRTDQSLQIRGTSFDDYKLVDIPNKYGGHDILLGLDLREHFIRIEQLKGVTAGHARVTEYGKPGFNNGFHSVVIHDIVKVEQGR